MEGRVDSFSSSDGQKQEKKTDKAQTCVMHTDEKTQKEAVNMYMHPQSA